MSFLSQSKLSHAPKSKYVLDFELLQVTMYLK